MTPTIFMMCVYFTDHINSHCDTNAKFWGNRFISSPDATVSLLSYGDDSIEHQHLRIEILDDA